MQGVILKKADDNIICSIQNSGSDTEKRCHAVWKVYVLAYHRYF